VIEVDIVEDHVCGVDEKGSPGSHPTSSSITPAAAGGIAILEIEVLQCDGSLTDK
jgi:hypothetical protein